MEDVLVLFILKRMMIHISKGKVVLKDNHSAHNTPPQPPSGTQR
jgi:hypothetical protein